MPRTPISTASGLLFLAASQTPLAADFDAATYHAQQCTSCHDSAVYTRAQRRVQSYPALASQVAMCDANLGTQMFPEEMALLTDFLNDSHYHFAR